MSITAAQRKKYREKREKYVEQNLPKCLDLLHQAVNEPGKISEAYSMFHKYSIHNAMLAIFQCHAMEIEPGPLATRKKWEQLGRKVKPEYIGKHQIWLCRPAGHFPVTRQLEDGTEETYFVPKFDYRPWWYTLSQTEGEPYNWEAEAGDWDIGEAIVNLEVEPVPFRSPSGNTMGYAYDRHFAINPVGKHQLATTFHELAHIVLKHTEQGPMTDTKELTRSQKELEAECVSMICMDALGHTDHTESRGYIQSWFKENEIDEPVARKILAAASAILKAGYSKEQ